MQQMTDLIQTETPGVLAEALDFMLYECSLDEAPSATDVKQWHEILTKRGGKFSRLATICQNWLDEESAS